MHDPNDMICDACDKRTSSVQHLGRSEGKLCRSCESFYLKEDGFQCECGSWDAYSNWIEGTLREGYCFDCTFWLNHVDSLDEESVIVEGLHYKVDLRKLVKPSAHGFLGFGGRTFRIKTFDGRSIITNDLWHQGTIPERFRDRLKDNAEFITEKENED